jgi:cell fate (sporulation/competence/biofilm development) regulator YlbF (YheA/YmcA/DUF963 family)
VTTRSLGVNGEARFEDRPTITYTPMTGSKFVRGLMTPLPPDSVFYTIQSGWPGGHRPARRRLVDQRLKNQSVSAAGVVPADPGFQRVVELLREIQRSGAVGMRVVQADQTQTSIVTFRTEGIAQETLEQIREMRQLLHLDPEVQDLRLAYGAVAADDKELAVLTNSMLHIMMQLAAYVEVPPEHIAEGRASRGWESVPGGPGREMVIRCTAERPEDAFVAVEYRERWFWIPDRDLLSKRALALLMLLFTLADTGTQEALPLITIPAQ